MDQRSWYPVVAVNPPAVCPGVQVGAAASVCVVEGRRVPCAGAVVHDARGRLLLVRRGTDPGRGLWSVPGGRVEPGETGRDAVVREVREETGLVVAPTDVAGTVERPAPDGSVYVIEDFVAVLAPDCYPATARAGDDADDVGWFTSEDLETLPCVDGLVETLRDWDVL
jgi:ADP-ribose pyrophosphatase YjhB (NUDIX family)